jgi:hypothetical protein
MKSLQDYLEIYRGIAKNLNLQGDSVEMISQMLANATYISEVENIAYSQEASLEKATLPNSKIQHCMNEMYSVFRGSCPRVIIKFKSTKYFRLNIFDELASSNNFKIYYLGYLDSNTSASSYDSSVTGTAAVQGETGFIYAPTVIPPTGDSVEYTVIGLLAKEVVSKTWTLSESNTYYVNFLEEDLSSDIYATVNGEYVDTTRVFSDHITKGCLFDLTIPSFGLRLYAPDIFRASLERTETETPANTEISCTAFKYCELDSFNTSELERLKIKGAVLSDFTDSFLTTGGYTQTATGLIYLSEVARDSLTTIHYKANRDRYVNSVLRSNSDIGTVLEEMYPEKVRKSGTHYVFSSPETTRVVEKKESTTFDLGASRSIGTSQYVTAASDLYMYSLQGSPSVIEGTDLVYSGVTLGTRLRIPGAAEFKSGIPVSKVLRVPVSGKSGVLRVLHSGLGDVEDQAIYDILPSVSVLLKENGDLVTQGISIHLVKKQSGTSSVLTDWKGIKSDSLEITYTIDSASKVYSLSGTNYIDLTGKSISEKLVVSVKKDSIVLDTETIPVIEDYGTEATESKYTLNLVNDVLTIEADYTGKALNLPLRTSAVLYKGTTQASGVTYEILSSPGVECEIDSSGQIEIIGVDQDTEKFSIPIRATLDNTSVVGILSLQKSTSLLPESQKPGTLVISSDSSGLEVLAEYKSSPSGTLSEYAYTNTGSQEYL